MNDETTKTTKSKKIQNNPIKFINESLTMNLK